MCNVNLVFSEQACTHSSSTQVKQRSAYMRELKEGMRGCYYYVLGDTV